MILYPWNFDLNTDDGLQSYIRCCMDFWMVTNILEEPVGSIFLSEGGGNRLFLSIHN
jgi:hypothetical protein